MSDSPDDTPDSTQDSAQAGQPYRVLARKYRPQTFEALIGQEAMVRTLRNAIAAKRLAHAFIMTGVRGVGKTTTARLIARALNCVGADGQGSETITPCGTCDFCTAIAAGTHPDVIEMDAASNTGVDDVRSIIDNVPYAAASARYKIYIIDEVHMLSRNAFNALLKTLEEPPAHVKFIFATTEIRKVPITVLSRCQRFDLKRIDSVLLSQHFKDICAQEDVDAQDEALALIAQAAEGSVRDGLSLLDQAIAHAGAAVTAEQVRDMIGLADRSVVLDLASSLFEGDVTTALDVFAKHYKDGADPLVVMEELLDMIHWLTKCRLYPNMEQDPSVSEQQRADGRALASKLQIPALNTAWQILSKGLGEIRTAPRPIAAAEMVIVRLGYAATLPSPEDLVKKWEKEPAAQSPAPQAKAPASQHAAPTSASSAPEASMQPSAQGVSSPVAAAAQPRPVASAAIGVQATQAQADSAPAEPDEALPQDTPGPHLRLVDSPPAAQPNTQSDAAPLEQAIEAFEELVRLCDAHKEGMLAYKLRSDVKVVECDPAKARLIMVPVKQPDQALAMSLRTFLQEKADQNWHIEYVQSGGDKTLAQMDAERAQAQRERALNDPAVKRALDLFPGAQVLDVRNLKKSDVPADLPLPKAPDGYDVLPDEAYAQDYDAGAHPFDPDFDSDL